ncbi:MAG TPA: carboxypeptidase regulatory-like domain-containing protein [Pyrinomonadaceae bacterium]|nr:carboxypeptidase regulatory-like domain-containing protein [Pyrinomonadaceae bacterium]
MNPHMWKIGIAALLITLAWGHQAASQNPDSPSKPLYQPTGNEAVLEGTISINGVVPSPKKIDMSADSICVQLNKDPIWQPILVNGDKLQNVLVFIKKGDPLEVYRFEQPDSDVLLEHRDCEYLPHILGMRVGQRLVINNRDLTQHNTHPTPRSNPEWNQSQPANSEPLVKSFARTEVSIPFKDNQHPWERAYVAVLDHPFFAVTDAFGNFQIRGLPPGTYTLVAWHETLAQQDVEITLVPGEIRKVDFTFKPIVLKP